MTGIRKRQPAAGVGTQHRSIEPGCARAHSRARADAAHSRDQGKGAKVRAPQGNGAVSPACSAVASLTCDQHACNVTPVASVTVLISLFFFPEKTGEHFVVCPAGGRFSAFASGEDTKSQRPVI